MSRIILHIDLDSFYAACEERRKPEIRGKPVVICMYSGRKDSGAVATANYAARALGIRAGLPLRTARARANKETVFLPADREFYNKVSGKIMGIFRSYSDSFEQRSIDEAYLDVSEKCKTYGKAEALAKEIKSEVLRKEKLTCSAGIGPNKLIAKMASREHKPDGLTIITPRSAKKFLTEKPVEKLFGIGPKTFEVLKHYKIKTINDLACMNVETLQKEFGDRKGFLLHQHSQGIDEGEVLELEKQQLSRIGTLTKDTKNKKTIMRKLSSLTGDMFRKIRKEHISFKTVSIITINTYLDTKTRSKTLEEFTKSKELFLKEIESLLKGFLKENPDEILRRCGVRVSTFPTQKKKQKSLTEF